MKLSTATIIIASIAQASARLSGEDSALDRDLKGRNGGSKGCPCISARSVLSKAPSCQISGGGSFEEGKGVVEDLFKGCVPLDYGSYCDKFDCPSNQFCYVDPDNCDAGDVTLSGYFPDGYPNSKVNPDGLFFSFETCDEASSDSSD